MENNMVLDTIQRRRSYRGIYLDTPVAAEDLRTILEAGLAAPSGCNKQTVSLVAVDDPEVLARLRAVIDPPVGETAPAMICVVTTPVAAYRDRYFHVQDYAAAIENMLLAIEALGYASCWVEGHITDEDHIGWKMGEILGVPQGSELICYLPLGLPAEEVKAPHKRLFDQRAWYNGYGRGFDPVTVRWATPSDLPRIQEMYTALVARMRRDGWDIWSDHYPREFVGEDIRLRRFFLLYEGDALCGAFALQEEDNGEGAVPWAEPAAPARYLYRFGLAAGFEGRGLGVQAMESVCRLAKRQGAEYLRLYAAAHNTPALGFYAKAGFTRMPGEYGEVLEDGTVLREYAFEKKL